ncbi:hypothetical protein [Methanoculleus sp.]|uniref:hypothetical protein n=1 Tax=Methanoculleus sp. TaxID=90427 RepID=UPI001BD6CA5A|nr:hypothetical protein [Methanoculleus sp.]
MSTTRTAARAKKARSRASPGLIPVGLRRRRAKNESGETWKNAAEPARSGAFEVRIVPDAARIVVVGRFEEIESWILLNKKL